MAGVPGSLAVEMASVSPVELASVSPVGLASVSLVGLASVSPVELASSWPGGVGSPPLPDMAKKRKNREEITAANAKKAGKKMAASE